LFGKEGLKKEGYYYLKEEEGVIRRFGVLIPKGINFGLFGWLARGIIAGILPLVNPQLRRG